MGNTIPTPPFRAYVRREVISTIDAYSYVLLFCAYVIAGVFTFAYFYQRHPITPGTMIAHGEQRVLASTFSGLGWPLYWVGKLAFNVTKPSENVESAP